MVPGTAPMHPAGPKPRARTPQLAVSNDACGEKRLRILNRATRAFLVHGLEGANLEDIAIAAGVGKVTIYRYFANKSDLFCHCVIQAVSDAAAPLRSILCVERPIEDVLIEFAETHTSRMIRPVAGSRPFYELARILLGTSLKHPDLARSCRSIFQRDLGEPLICYFQAMVDQGQVKGDPTFLMEHFAQTIFFTNSVILEPERAPTEIDLHTHAETTVRLFLYGCKSA